MKLRNYFYSKYRLRYFSLKDWKPGATAPVSTPSTNNVDSLNQEITKQGDLVRSLKSSKAEKAKVDEAVKTLLELKAKYKTATGQVRFNFTSFCKF